MKRSPHYAVFVGFFGEHFQVIKSFTKSSPMEILYRNNEIMSCVELLCPNCRPSRKCFKSRMVLKDKCYVYRISPLSVNSDISLVQVV